MVAHSGYGVLMYDRIFGRLAFSNEFADDQALSGASSSTILSHNHIVTSLTRRNNIRSIRCFLRPRPKYLHACPCIRNPSKCADCTAAETELALV